MAQDYKLSLDDAAARLERQLSFEEFSGVIMARWPDLVAGTAIDNNLPKGGLVVGLTDLEQSHAVTELAPRDIQQYLHLVAGAQSMNDQVTTRAKIDAVLDRASAGWVQDYFWQTNTMEWVVFDDITDSALNTVRESVESIANPLGIQLKLSRLRRPSPETVKEDAPACTADNVRPLRCDAPLRGGTQIQISPNGGSCTSGFMTRSDVDNKPYILTAGHCDPSDSAGWVWVDPTNGKRVVGASHNMIVSPRGGHADYGLINVGSQYDIVPRLLHLQSSGTGFPTTRAELYPVKSSGNSVDGSYACKTGISEGTACGQVKSQVFKDRRGIGPMGRIAFPLNQDTSGEPKYVRAVCSGDSGGPVYVAGKAYGIIAGFGDPVTETNSPWVSSTTLCTGEFGYTKITYALLELHAHLVILPT